jgi:hypothetical protein
LTVTPLLRWVRGITGAAAADAGRLSPLPPGRWWPAVTPTFGTALADQRGLARPPYRDCVAAQRSQSRALPGGRVCDGAQTAPPLTLIFHRQRPRTYRKDGAERDTAVSLRVFFGINHSPQQINSLLEGSIVPIMSLIRDRQVPPLSSRHDLIRIDVLITYRDRVHLSIPI